MNPLATRADLLARNISIPAGLEEKDFLDAASSSIRDAAGGAITRTTAKLQLVSNSEQYLPLGVSPVHGVSNVKIGESVVSDYTFLGDRLWRASGWQNGRAPELITADVDFGLEKAPADIVDLCCSLAAAAMIAAAEDGYDPKRGLANIRIDDYSEGYFRGDDEIVNPLELPERTRSWLRSRFGVQAHVTGTY